MKEKRLRKELTAINKYISKISDRNVSLRILFGELFQIMLL